MPEGKPGSGGRCKVAVKPARERTRTAYAAVRAHVKAHDARERVFIVHRLDRSTSGLLVFAKTNEAKERLQTAFAGRTVDRVYHTVLEGVLATDEGTLRFEDHDLLAAPASSQDGAAPAVARTICSGWLIHSR